MTKTNTRLPTFFSVRDMAAHIGVSTKTIGRWITQGHLRAHRLGRQIRIAEDDALAFVAARRK
jgi:excisionase family DNA binding protein